MRYPPFRRARKQPLLGLIINHHLKWWLLTRKILKKFLQIGKNFAYLPYTIIYKAYEIKACLKTEYCNIHTEREDMCSHYVGAPRYACPDSVRGKREGMEIIY